MHSLKHLVFKLTYQHWQGIRLAKQLLLGRCILQYFTFSHYSSWQIGQEAFLINSE